MCGILGSCRLPLTPLHLESLNHRGPDGSGLEQVHSPYGTVFLGHTRLAVLDLSPAGHQPMQSRDGRWWLTFNGEIYNYLQLRRKLSVPLRGHSDTETLLELIAAQGVEKTLSELNGMFAFAVLDTLENHLYLARDPFGIKPLYYHHHGGRFAFASEARVLRQLLPETGIDPDGLRQFLTLRYVPSPSTLWKGIQRLPPGHVLVIDLKDKSGRPKPFIEPTREQFAGSMDEAITVYRSEVASAVKRQMLADVPVGILLSGGIDSALVASMAREAGYEPPCFTVGFAGGHDECEIADARHTAALLGLPFQAVAVSAEQLRQALPAIVQAVEEPLATTSVMPMWYLVQRARKDVTVVLTGQGVDEPWGGYYRYQMELLRNHLPWTGPWRLGQALSLTAMESGAKAVSPRSRPGRPGQ